MKIILYQANQGDCLLLTARDGTTLLVDGGMKGSYRKHVARSIGTMARTGTQIDLVCVSHIDRDHINGILQLMDDLAAWRVFDYQRGSGNTIFPCPKGIRPPAVRAIWHNAFKDQVADNSGAIEDQLVANMKLFNMSGRALKPGVAQHARHYDQLATGVREGLQLSNRIGRNQLNIPTNQPFGGGLVSIEEPQHPPPKFSHGGMDLFLIGPFKEDLEKLRDEWNDWLRKNQEAVQAIREGAAEDEEQFPLDEGQLILSSLLALAAELGDRNAVTTPNLASIMLLVEEAGKTVLLTGDGHADDILKGLEAHGKLDNAGRIHVDVLKVQHHGSEHNIHEDFCKAVTADHYVICANGSHRNPDLDVLQTIIDSRLGAAAGDTNAGRPFKLWFNSSANRAGTEKRTEHMEQVEKLVKDEATRNRWRIKHRFLTRGSKLTFEI